MHQWEFMNGTFMSGTAITRSYFAKFYDRDRVQKKSPSKIGIEFSDSLFFRSLSLYQRNLGEKVCWFVRYTRRVSFFLLSDQRVTGTEELIQGTQIFAADLAPIYDGWF